VIETLYCHTCKRNYKVRTTDIELMKTHDSYFNGKEYTKGCFFKELNRLKRLKLNQ